jgi:hypothetical protein
MFRSVNVMHPNVPYLRFGYTTLCVAASVLVLMLWLRSLRQTELLYDNHFNGGATSFTSTAGHIQFKSWKISYRGGLHGGVVLKASNWEVPYWVPLVILVVLGALPWIRHPKWHFSLRTLLIIITLTAAILGLVAYATSTD